MNSRDIRQSFVEFFRQHDHSIVPSSPLVTHGDPTLLFTNAGMVPFKNVFLGLEEPPYSRAVSTQKCLRVSGKHNDLENVGPSPRHHTFFEMLGNFSFGDYFKEQAILYAWELVTEVWGLGADRLFATVYEEDDEAEALWRKISCLPAERIRRCGKADNFWTMGPVGPCGPSSEIFVDLKSGDPQVPWQEGCDSGRYLEIWNLVFMQLNRDEAGRLSPLPNPSIDTGAGLERVAAILQGVESNYDTDLFQPLIGAAAELLGTSYGRDRQTDVSLRVIADHLRALSFLLADSVIPGPDGRGYVARRLLRRAVRHGMRIGFEEPFLHRLVPVLGQVMGSSYSELGATEQATMATIREEEEKYLATRASGARRVQQAIDQARQEGRDRLSGEELFTLYDTHGLELEAVREIAQEEKLEVDESGFTRLMDERRQDSRAATGKLQQRLASLRQALYQDGETGETDFLGYHELELVDATVIRLANTAGENVQVSEAIEAGEHGVVVLDRTVFYAESGGQVGDHGELRFADGSARVVDTQKDTSGTLFHFVEVIAGSLRSGMIVALEVDAQRRRAIERNHTATHLLHAALRQALGEGVRQAGSLVAPDRLRFDFTYNRPLDGEALTDIESQVNRWIRKAVATEITLRDHQEAVAGGAMALFGEKYGDRVRTVEIPGFSYELCGGCHVENSGAIGLFLITAERGVASGVRRIEALTGKGAFDQVRQARSWGEAISAELGVAADRVLQEIAGLKNKNKELERELAKLRMQQVAGGPAASEELEVAGIRLVAREVPAAPAGELRQMADALRDKLGSGVVVLGAREEGKVSLIVAVSKDLTAKLSAGKLISRLATLVGGRGGGRPDFAQAGGREPENLPQLLAAVPRELEQQLTTSS